MWQARRPIICPDSRSLGQTASRDFGQFRTQMAASPAFMMKAMGLRTAVTSGTDAEIGALLRECFALAPPDEAVSVAKLRERYPAPS